jgi:hypothetical protein
MKNIHYLFVHTHGLTNELKYLFAGKIKGYAEQSIIWPQHVDKGKVSKGILKASVRAPDNFQVQRVITPYFWKWWVFAYFLCTIVLSTSEKIAYMYTSHKCYSINAGCQWNVYLCLITIVSCLLIKCCEYFVFCSSTSAVFTALLIMSSMIPLTILSLDTDETVRNLSIAFSVALLCLVAHLFMSLLIFNEQRVPKFTSVLVLTYYVNRIYL